MAKLHNFYFLLLLCLCPPLVSNANAKNPEDVQYPRVPRVSILSVTGKRYPAITHALSTVGFEAHELPVDVYRSSSAADVDLLVIPEAEAQRLNTALIQNILRDVQNGVPLLLDGRSRLAVELGMTDTLPQIQVMKYYWPAYSELPVRLPAPQRLPQVHLSSGLQVLATDVRHKAPLVVSGTYGRGRFVYTVIPFEPQQGMVFQYLPFLVQAIVDQLRVRPSLMAENLGVYLDVGGEPKIDPDALATQLKNWSVREVHLGAFYGSEMFAKFIPRFLAAAHRQGIAVYAWLEYPMVSTEFWLQHPEWRETTSSGHAAEMDWRYHMALEDPSCFAAVAELTRRLVLDYDWDGVDLAELYFESDPGVFDHPREFTPMGKFFRQIFKQRYGIDPKEMFDPSSRHYGPRDPELRNQLKDFRVDLVTQLTEQFLHVLARCRPQKPYLQTTLTFIDALRDPSVTERFGVDPERLLALQERFGFAVEIEDPYTVWNSGPDRYSDIGQHYRARLKSGMPLSIDVNVVDRIPPGRPLNKPRGLELYEMVANVAAYADMVTLYAFDTLSADDMRLVPAVAGAQQLVEPPANQGTVRVRRQMVWQAKTRGYTVYADGREWPCRSGSVVLIPAGTHRIEMRPDTPKRAHADLQIEYVNATIVAAEQSGEQVTLTYESRGRCYMILNRAPASILCDGAAGLAQVLTAPDHVCLVLPQGKHTLLMR